MTAITIKTIDLKDLDKARQFAASGMDFSQYVTNNIELYLYSKYVLSLELANSTVALGAYLDDRLVGFLFARFEGESKIYRTWTTRLIVSLGNWFIKLSGNQELSNQYDEANRKMFQRFSKQKPDGEITYFAVDPAMKGKKIGTRLLDELVKRYKERLVYLYTDSNCNYPFYLKRGFEIVDQAEINFSQKSEKAALTCFLMKRRL